jgi:anti-sigma B factor antagonist
VVVTWVDLTVSRDAKSDHAVVAVSGEIDVSSAPELQERLLELIASGAHRLVVDLGDVGFMDSTGLGALVAGRAAAVDAGGALAVACDQERLVKLFTITGLDAAFQIAPTVDAAIATIPGPAATS